MSAGAALGQFLCPIIVGRDAELDAIDGLLASADAGEGGVVFLVGEPGIGKSRLAREAAARARATGMEMLQGRCAPSLAPTPYRPFVEALQRHQAVDAAALFPDAEPNRLRVFDGISRALASLAPAVGVLLVISHRAASACCARSETIPGARLTLPSV